MMVGCNVGGVWNLIPRGKVGVEIGVWKGDTSAQFLRRSKFLHLVDPWSREAYGDFEEHGGPNAFLAKYSKVVGSRKPEDFDRFYDEMYREVCRRFECQSVEIHRKTSAAFFATFAGPVDWVYVDGLHTYEGCRADLEGSLRIVHPGGAIFGDDYGNKKGVTKAVDSFSQSTGLDVRLYGNQYRIDL